MAFVVAEGRPQGGGAEHLGVNFKNRLLIVSVSAVGIGIIAEEEAKIGGAVARKFGVCVAHGELRGAFCAGVAEHPDPRRAGRPGRRRCGERIDRHPQDFAVAVFVFGGAHDRIEVAPARQQLAELHDVFGADAEGFCGLVQRVGGETVADE